MKRFAALFLAALFLLTPALPAAAQDVVTVDGKAVSLDVQPMILGGVLMVPVRPVAEALGGQVTWNQDKLTESITTGSTTVNLTVGKSTADVNGHEVPLGMAVGLQGNQVLVPAGFLLAVYGQRVNIASAGLKDPTAMALLDKALTAIPTQVDLQLDHQITVDAGDPDALSLTLRAHISTQVQLRGKEALLTTTVKVPKALGGELTLLTAVKGDKIFVKAPGSKWAPAPEIDGMLGVLKSLNAPQALGAYVRETHLGDMHTVGGQRVQDVAVTYDTATFQKLTDQLLKGALPQDTASQVQLNWDSVTAGLSLDTATGAPVGPQTTDASLSIALPADLSDVPLHIRIHQTATPTANDKPIVWPPDLPAK